MVSKQFQKNNDFFIKTARKFAYNEFVIYICNSKTNKGRRCENGMSYKERLINQIFRLLAIIETPANQSIIRQIEGLLNTLRDQEKQV